MRYPTKVGGRSRQRQRMQYPVEVGSWSLTRPEIRYPMKVGGRSKVEPEDAIFDESRRLIADTAEDAISDESRKLVDGRARGCDIRWNCEPCGPRFPNSSVATFVVRAFSVPSKASGFPIASREPLPVLLIAPCLLSPSGRSSCWSQRFAVRTGHGFLHVRLLAFRVFNRLLRIRPFPPDVGRRFDPVPNTSTLIATCRLLCIRLFAFVLRLDLSSLSTENFRTACRLLHIRSSAFHASLRIAPRLTLPALRLGQITLPLALDTP